MTSTGLLRCTEAWMDIANKLPVAFRHQEVCREAVQNGNVRLAAHRVEVAIGNIFLLPLSL